MAVDTKSTARLADRFHPTASSERSICVHTLS